MIFSLERNLNEVQSLVGLRIKDITNVKHGFKMVKVYAGEMEEYTTFLTPEASYAYDEYIKHRMDSGEEITPTCYVFRHRTSEYKQVDRTAVNMRLKRIIIYRMLSSIEGYEYDQKIKVDRLHRKQLLQECVLDGRTPDLGAWDKQTAKEKREMLESVILNRQSRVRTKNQIRKDIRAGKTA